MSPIGKILKIARINYRESRESLKITRHETPNKFSL